MKIVWTKKAEEDLNYWRRTDIKKVKKIKQLLENIIETPYNGIGKPEALKHSWSGFWSRRITAEHRLIYRCDEDTIKIVSCRFHYE